MKEHRYELSVEWTGNDGEGTKTYRGYRRDHTITVPGKPVLPGSSDPCFRGDASRYNPEELLLAAVSGCHMLSYLHRCAANGINVIEYRDAATGVMRENTDGSGEFVRVVLHPHVTIAPGDDAEKARALHHDAHQVCFIARSVNFPIAVEAEVIGASDR